MNCNRCGFNVGDGVTNPHDCVVEMYRVLESFHAWMVKLAKQLPAVRNVVGDPPALPPRGDA